MGAAISAFQSSIRDPIDHPLYLLVGAGFALLANAIGFVLGLIPLVGQFVHVVVVVSLLNTGLIGMAYAISKLGDTSVDAFFKAVRANYLTVALTYVITVVVSVALVFALTILLTFVVGIGGAGVGALAGSGPGAGAGASGVAALGAATVVAMLLFLLVTLLPVMAFQFVGPAAVVDDCSVGDAIRKSVGLLAAKPLSVLGYTLLRWGILVVPILLVLVLVSVVAGASVLTAAGPAAGAEAGSGLGAASALGIVALGGIALAGLWFLLYYPFFMSYHVVYYRRATGAA